MIFIPQLLALALLAQAPPAQPVPEQPVQLQVVKRAKPGVLQRVGKAFSHGLRRLWEREEPNAVQGNALVAENKFDAALKAYDAADAKLPKQGSAAAALSLDRASALLHQGPEEAPRALEEAGRALASPDAATRAKAAYSAALAMEAAGKTKDAIAGYGRALALDPQDEDSKVNLELLLRTEERKKKQQSKQGEQDKQKPQQKQGEDKQQAQDKKGDQQKKDSPQDQQQQPQDKQAQDKKDAEQKQEEQKKEQAGEQQKQADAKQQPGEQPGAGKPLDRSEAQRLLDALRASEKNLQVWRFGKRPKDQQRSPAARDW